MSFYRGVAWRGVAWRGVAWRGEAVKHSDSQHRGCEFDPLVCRNKNAIGEEGNKKPHQKVHFPRKNSEPCLMFPLRSNLSMQRSLTAWSNRLFS